MARPSLAPCGGTGDRAGAGGARRLADRGTRRACGRIRQHCAYSAADVGDCRCKHGLDGCRHGRGAWRSVGLPSASARCRHPQRLRTGCSSRLPPKQVRMVSSCLSAPRMQIQTGPSWKLRSMKKAMSIVAWNPDRMSARIAPHGGGLLVGNDSTRPSGRQTVVLAREPTGRFRVLPEPSAGVLLGAGEADDPGESGDTNAETLAEKEGSGRSRMPRLKTKATPKPISVRSAVRAILALPAGTVKNGRVSRLSSLPATRAASRSWRSPAPRPRICGCSARPKRAVVSGSCCSSARKSKPANFAGKWRRSAHRCSRRRKRPPVTLRSLDR